MHYCPGRHTSYFAPLLPPQDEPTSGLDSFTALNLMRTMKQVGRGWQARSRPGAGRGTSPAPRACATVLAGLQNAAAAVGAADAPPNTTTDPAFAAQFTPSPAGGQQWSDLCC